MGLFYGENINYNLELLLIYWFLVIEMKVFIRISKKRIKIRGITFLKN